MKNLFPVLFLSFVLLGIVTDAQTHLVWSSREHILNSSANQSVFSITNGNGQTLISEQAEDISLGADVNYFISFDSSGTKQWEFNNDTCYGICDESYPFIIPSGNGGGLFLGSYTDHTGSVQFRLKRVSSNGTLQWQQFWITPFLSVYPVDYALDHLGNLNVAFSAYTDSASAEDFVIAQFDTTSGLLNWYLQVPDGGQPGAPLSEVLTSICTDNLNTIYACGHATDISGSNECYVLSVEPSGSLNYRLTFGQPGADTDVRKIITDNNGFVYTGGYAAETLLVNKINVSTQAIQWTQNVTRDTADLSFVDLEIINNKIYLLNNFRYFYPDSTSSGGRWHNQHYSLTEYDLAGSPTNRSDFLTSLDVNARQDGSGGAKSLSFCDGGFYVLSSQILNTTGNHYGIIQKIDPTTMSSVWYDTTSINNDPGRISFDTHCDVYLNFSFDFYGTTTYTVLNKYSDAITNSIQLNESSEYLKVFPNPVQETLHFDIPEKYKNQPFSLKIFSITGDLISSIHANSSLNSISTNSLSPGFYIIKLFFDNQNVLLSRFVKQ